VGWGWGWLYAYSYQTLKLPLSQGCRQSTQLSFTVFAYKVIGAISCCRIAECDTNLLEELVTEGKVIPLQA